ncbi:Protein of unknown function [Gryllus bimaculatus]|nr:Protein of unknown function [Gryllus bimaculatus]
MVQEERRYMFWVHLPAFAFMKRFEDQIAVENQRRSFNSSFFISCSLKAKEAAESQQSSFTSCEYVTVLKTHNHVKTPESLGCHLKQLLMEAERKVQELGGGLQLLKIHLVTIIIITTILEHHLVLSAVMCTRKVSQHWAKSGPPIKNDSDIVRTRIAAKQVKGITRAAYVMIVDSKSQNNKTRLYAPNSKFNGAAQKPSVL